MNIHSSLFLTMQKNMVRLSIDKEQGTWTKPNTDTLGKHFVSKEGNDIFVYWDLNAPANDNGNKWRQATNPINIVREVA